MTNQKTENQEKANITTQNDSTNYDARSNNTESHKKTAAHHSKAAKHHLEAAKNHENMDFQKAAVNTVLAFGHSAIAGEFLSDNAKHHSQELKQTNYK